MVPTSTAQLKPDLCVSPLVVQYVSTPYGIGRLILPHDPRTDGIVIVQLKWATLYTNEDAIQRITHHQHSPKPDEGQLNNTTNGDKTTSPNSPSKGKKRMIDFPTFAPLSIPLARRRQTLALAVSSFAALVCCIVALLCIRSNGIIFYAFLAYVVWMLLFQVSNDNADRRVL